LSEGYGKMVEYVVSQDGKRIDTHPKGVLDLKDALDYFRRLNNDKEVKKGAIEIIHFHKVSEFKFSHLESKNIATSFQEPRETQKLKATIFVCESELAYGIGRMLQTFNEIANPKHKVVIVRSESEVYSVINESNP
jgi:hypothetical protein